LFLLTLTLFTAGSALCAIAWNNPSLVVFRVIQGLGGGMMMPLATTMLYKVVPPAERNAISWPNPALPIDERTCRSSRLEPPTRE
jgi:MFS family permease